MINQLFESLPETDAYRRYHAGLAPLAWYFGRSMYLETYWLREVVQSDDEITTRVRQIFSPDSPATDAQLRQLPPRDHLLNWALELQDDTLMRLANPRLLGEHQLMTEGRLVQIILQQHAKNYENMLMVLTQRRLGEHHRVEHPLTGQSA